jgi:hypothetical protein
MIAAAFIGGGVALCVGVVALMVVVARRAIARQLWR